MLKTYIVCSSLYRDLLVPVINQSVWAKLPILLPFQNTLSYNTAPAAAPQCEN